MADAPLAPARIVVVHHLRAASEGAHGETAANDLAERGQVRADAEARLGPARRHPERDDLVKDEDNAQPLRHFPQAFEKAGLGQQHARVGEERIHDEPGDVASVLLEDLDARLGVVPRQHDGVLEDGVGHAR